MDTGVSQNYEPMKNLLQKQREEFNKNFPELVWEGATKSEVNYQEGNKEKIKNMFKQSQSELITAFIEMVEEEKHLMETSADGFDIKIDAPTAETEAEALQQLGINQKLDDLIELLNEALNS